MTEHEFVWSLIYRDRIWWKNNFNFTNRKKSHEVKSGEYGIRIVSYNILLIIDPIALRIKLMTTKPHIKKQ